MDVRVTGSREKFQSDLNFSIQVEDVNNTPQIAELRRRFFKEFEDSDRGEDIGVLTPKAVSEKSKKSENSVVKNSGCGSDGTVENLGNSDGIGEIGSSKSVVEGNDDVDNSKTIDDVLDGINLDDIFGDLGIHNEGENFKVESTKIENGNNSQSSEGTDLENRNTMSFRESINQRREGKNPRRERRQGSRKDIEQKLEGLNQKSEKIADNGIDIEQTNEKVTLETGSSVNRKEKKHVIYVELKYNEDGWSYSDEVDPYENEGEIEEGIEDVDTDFSEDEESAEEEIGNDEDEDDFPDDWDNDEEEEENEGIDSNEKSDEDETDGFFDSWSDNEEVGEGTTDVDADGNIEDAEEDDEEDDFFSSWGDDEEQEESSDDFSPMDSSEDIIDPDAITGDSKASKNFLDMVRSKTPEKKESKSEKAIPINKGKTIDESWRKTSEVGDIDDLWSFDSMNDLDGEEFDNMLYGESELDKRCENFSDVEVPDVEKISKEREARKRIGNSKRGVDAVKEEKKEEIKEVEQVVEDTDDEDDLFAGLDDFDEDEEVDEVDKDVTDEEDDDNIFGDLDFEDEEETEEEVQEDVQEDVKEAPKKVVETKIPKEVKVEEKKVEPKEQKPKVSKGDYKTLRDFVKANTGCTLSEALELFSKKEIEKDLKMGRVYQRRDKLFI